MQAYFSGLDLTQVPYDILFDYGLPMLDTRGFNGLNLTPENLVYSYDIWKYGYGAMSLGQVNGNTSFQGHEQVFASLENHYNQNQRYPLVVLLAKYSRIKDDAIANNLIYELNDVLYDTPGRTESPYETHNVFMGSIAHSQSIVSSTVPFEFKSEWLYSNVMTFESMLVDFGDGNGPIVVTDGFRRDISYPDTGTYTITYEMQTNYGTMVAHSSIRISRLAPVFDLGINVPANGTHDGLNMQIDFGCGRTKLMKPLIYVQGFEFLGIDEINIDDARNVLDRNFHTAQMSENEYDLVFIKLNNPQDDIIRNSEALKAAIHLINAMKWQNGSHEPNLVIGESMGGLISRLALNSIELEQQNDPTIKHDCSRLIVFDSPNQGANVPLSFQMMAQKLGGSMLYWFISDLRNAVKALNSTAAQQMLIYHVDDDASGVRTEFDAYLQQFGNPQQCEVTGISNGVDNGTDQGFQPGDPYIHIDNTSTPLTWNMGFWGKVVGIYFFLLPVKVKGKLILNSLPPYNSNPTTIVENEMYIELFWGLKKNYLIQPYVYSVTEKHEYDAAPGGFYPVEELGFFEHFHDDILADRFGYILTSSGLNTPINMTDPFLDFHGVNVTAVNNGQGWTTFDRVAREGSNPMHNIDNRFHVTITEHNRDTIIDVMRDWEISAGFVPSFGISSSTFNYGEDIHGLKTSSTHNRNTLIVNNGRLCINCHVPVGASGMTTAQNAVTESFGVSFVRPCGNTGNITIDVGSNGKFELGTNINQYSKSHFAPNTHLIIRSGGELIIHDKSQLSIDAGAKLTLEPGAIITLNGAEAVLEISGELVLPANFTFEFAGNGFVRFNTPTITAGSNAKFAFVGANTSDKIVSFSPNSIFYVPANVTEFKLENGLVEMGNASIVDLFTKVILKDALVTGSTSAMYNRFSISAKSGTIIQNTNFKHGTIGLRLGQQSLVSPFVDGCSFENNHTGIFLNTTAQGAQIKSSSFNHNQTSIKGEGLSLPVHIEGCNIQSSEEGIRLQGWNMTQFNVKNSTIHASATGVRVFGGNLTIEDVSIQGVATNNQSVGLLIEGNSVARPRCVNINNYHVGADVGTNCHLNMATSSNSNFINNTVGLIVNNSSLSLQNASSRLDANSLYSILGHLKPTPEFQKEILHGTYESFEFYKWPIHKLKLNTQPYPTLSASGFILNNISPISTDEFTAVNGTITHIDYTIEVPVFIDCQQCNHFFACETVSEPPYYSEWVLNPANGAVGRLVHTSYFPGVEFINAIRSALDDITFVPDQPINDLQAVLKLKQLLSLSFSDITEEEYLAKQAAAKYMGLALSNAYAYEQLAIKNINEPEPLNDEEIFLIDFLEDQKSSAEEFIIAELVIAQAQVYRLAGHYETAIQLINSPEAIPALHNKQAYWSCLLPLEYDYLVGSIDDQTYLEQSSDCGNLWQMRRKGYPSNRLDNSVEIVQKNRVNIYPNPGTSEFSLKIPGFKPDDVAVLEVYDNQGRRLIKQNYLYDQKVLSSNLPAGAYQISIYFKTNKYNSLWIKY
ncbi:MAG: T9SS type A sorting domain-containing protein [Bacteroidia bacterium]